MASDASFSQGLLVLSILLYIYPFILYPAILFLLVPGRSVRVAASELQSYPTVALVICALNEAGVIGQKIENSLALDYPRERLRIVVVSDGSTDSTAVVAHKFEKRGVEVIERQQRRGKVENIKDVISSSGEEVVVLSDANVLYHPQALKKLINRFDDRSIGCVSGRVVLQNTTLALASSEKSYYALEWCLQEKASTLYSMAGSDGAMYALRRALFVPPPSDTLIDDFVIAMAVVRKGSRVVFEREAIGWQEGPSTPTEEFHRKVRMAAGAAQALVRGNGWPARAPLIFWFEFLSHKLLRWLSPFVGLAALVLALATWTEPLSAVVTLGSALVASLAAVRLVTGRDHAMLNVPFYFLLGQVALAVGFVKGLIGKQSVRWKKADR